MASARVFPVRLDISDMKLASEALKESHFIDANWFDLGVELNLPYPQLKNIEDSYMNNPSRCLRECLSLWLTSANNRTWELLASALERMNKKPAATLIRNTYGDPASQIIQHYSDRISQVSLTDSCIQLLYTEGLITEDTQRKIERCGGSLSDTLRELMIAVSDDHSKLRSLGNILMELEETKPLAQDIIKDCDEIINKPVTKAVNRPATGSTVNQLPNTKTTLSASAGEFFFNAAHQSMFDEVRGHFGILIDKLIPLISQSKTPVAEIKSFLIRSFPELSTELSDADSIEAIVNVVVKKCRVNNISVIKIIVLRFEITQAEALISNYEGQIKAVCGSLQNFLSQNQSEHFDNSETIQFTLGWEPEGHSLDDIRNLLEEAFKALNKRIIVQSIHRVNSIIIICYGPHHLLAALLLEAQDNLTVLIKEFSLIRLAIGHYTVYDKRIRYKVMNNECFAEIKLAGGEEQELRTLLDYKEAIGSKNRQMSMIKKRKVQLMLSRSVQMLRDSLIENKILKAKATENIQLLQKKVSLKKKVESLKEELGMKNKMLTAKTAEIENFERLSEQKIKDGKHSVAATKEFIETTEAAKEQEKDNEDNKQLEKSDESKQEIEMLLEKISKMSEEQIDKDETLKAATREKEITSSKLDEMSQLLEKERKESMITKKEAESLKEELDAKSKMLNASMTESDRFKRIAAETKQLLQDKISHLTEQENENKNLKEIKELLKEQLVLFLSEKDDLVEKTVEKHEETQMQTVSHQEENEAIQMSLTLRKELKEKDKQTEQKLAESKKEIEILQIKITTMHLQRMEMDKKVQELMLKIKNLEKALPKDKNYQENDKLNKIKEILEKQLVLFQSENEDGKQLVAVIEKLAETNKAKETNEDTKHEQTTDENEKLEQLMLSQNGHLIKREQKLTHLIEEIQNLQAQVEQLSNDEAHSKLEHMKRQNDIMLKENKNLLIELHEELSTLRQDIYSSQWKKSQLGLKQDPNPIVYEDDIYDFIKIDHPLLIKIVRTEQFIRLKKIKKLGYTYHNIPRATCSRYEQSIGMYFFAEKFVKTLRKRQPELNITDSDVLCVQIAALCYNLGHGPFSHIFEMFLDEIFPNGDKPWESLSEASVMMFDHMIEENDEVKNLLEKSLDEEDIAFIKELIHGTRKGQRKGKEFLYEIVVNKTSGLDVCMIDYTTRDAAALGMNISFKWRVFLSKVQVKSENGELHIFFQKDDLKIYNDLFETCYNLHRNLYYLRKNRIVALIIKRILVKSNKKPIIRDGDRLVTMSEATKSMSAFIQLDDSVLTSHDDDPEVQVLLNCLDSKKSIGRIGHVMQTFDWHKEQIKQYIVQSTKSYDISDHLIIDPIIHGYENHESLTQYYYTSDGRTGQWTHEWAQLPPTAHVRVVAPLRIFLVSGNMDLIHEVQKVLRELQTNEGLNGDTYSNQDNFNLMPIHEMTEPKPLAAKDNDK